MYMLGDVFWGINGLHQTQDEYRVLQCSKSMKLDASCSLEGIVNKEAYYFIGGI